MPKSIKSSKKKSGKTISKGGKVKILKKPKKTISKGGKVKILKKSSKKKSAKKSKKNSKKKSNKIKGPVYQTDKNGHVIMAAGPTDLKYYKKKAHTPKVKSKVSKSKVKKSKIPVNKTVTVSEIIDLASKQLFPNQYPSHAFLQEHYEIIKPYHKYINAYKGVCFTEINNYYRTGEVIMQGCVTQNISSSKKTPEEVIKEVAEKMEELYDKVKPLEHDIIVYRGINKGMLGQNLFDGKCISSVKYNMDQHYFCDKQDIIPISLFKNYDPKENVHKYVYETLGFASVSANINTSFGFAQNDTLLMLRMPAGTKFIMPLNASLSDNEYEFILFPYNNTFIIYDEIPNGYHGTSLFAGGFCNDMNQFKTTKSIQRPFKIKFGSTHEWEKDINENDPVTAIALHPPTLGTDFKKCGWGDAHPYHFCDPETGKYIGDNPENRKKIKEKIAKSNTIGKCSTIKVKECIDNNQLCDPQIGECDKLEKYNNDKFFQFTDPQKIIDLQNPRYKCTEDSIKICADLGELCNPYIDGACSEYNEKNLWFVNNGLSKEDLAKLEPRGKCTKEKIEKFAELGDYGYLCNPDTGYEMKFNKDHWEKFDNAKDIPVEEEVTEDYIPLPGEEKLTNYNILNNNPLDDWVQDIKNGAVVDLNVPKVSELKYFANKLGVKSSGKKQDIINAIKAVYPVKDIKKPIDNYLQNIKNGITVNLNVYNVSELKYIAKKLGLKSSGKKQDIINNIKSNYPSQPIVEDEDEDVIEPFDEEYPDEDEDVEEPFEYEEIPDENVEIVPIKNFNEPVLVQQFKEYIIQYNNGSLTLEGLESLFSLKELKEIAKWYKVKVTGNKVLVLNNILEKL